MIVNNSRQLRVLHIAETIRGGIATYLNELCPLQCATYGQDNISFVIPAEHVQDLEGPHAANISTFTRTGRNALSFLRLARAAAAKIRTCDPDIIHLHSTFAGMIVRPLLPFLSTRARVVYCPHGWAFERSSKPMSGLFARFVERALSKLTDRIVCVSGSELRAGRSAGIGDDRLSLVRSGIRAQRPESIDRQFHKWITPKLKVLFVGRFDRQKGIDVLLDAAERLPDLVDLRLVGSNVVGKTGKMTLPANVSVLGWLSRGEIEAQYDAAQVVVISSRWEAFGLVALEAMRAGKPIVASKVGALPEIIADGSTGLLCKPEDGAALAAALEAIIGADLAELGRRGFMRFRSLFTADRTHRDLCAVYAEVGVRTRERAFAEDSAASPMTK